MVTINSTYLSLVHCCSSKHGPNHHHHHSHSRHPPIQLSAYHSVGSPQFRRTTRVNTTRSFCLYRGKYLLAWLADWLASSSHRPPSAQNNKHYDRLHSTTNQYPHSGRDRDRESDCHWMVEAEMVDNKTPIGTFVLASTYHLTYSGLVNGLSIIFMTI